MHALQEKSRRSLSEVRRSGGRWHGRGPCTGPRYGERKRGASFCRLWCRTKHVRANIVPGNPGDPLKVENPLGRNAGPRIQRRVFDPERSGERDNTTGLFGPFLNNVDHVAEGSLNLHSLSSDYVGAKW